MVRFFASHNTKDAAVLIRQNRVDRRLSDDSHIIRQAVSHMGEDFAVHIRPQMTDAGRNESQVSRSCLSLQRMEFLQMLIPVDLPVCPAELAVNGIHVGNQAGQFALIHVIVQIAAVIRRQRQLPVRESPRSAPAGDNICAPVARRRRPVLVQSDTIADIQPFFKNQHRKARICDFQRSENPRRACANNNHIIILSHVTHFRFHQIRRKAPFPPASGKTGNKKAPHGGRIICKRLSLFLFYRSEEGNAREKEI